MTEDTPVEKPSPFIFVPKFKAREKVVTLPDGTRARVHIDASGTVKHTETDDRMDAVVRPRLITVRMRPVQQDQADPDPSHR